MEGLIRKNVSEVKFFQRNLFPKRYFVIDFTKANVYISHHENFNPRRDELLEIKGDPKITIIPFRSVKDCYKPF